MEFYRKLQLMDLEGLGWFELPTGVNGDQFCKQVCDLSCVCRAMQGIFKELRWGGWEAQVYGYAGKFSAIICDTKMNWNDL